MSNPPLRGKRHGHLVSASRFTLFAALLVTACAGTNIPHQPSDLPLRYHNSQYGLTFFLPAAWQGYSVSVQQLDDESYSPAEDKPIIVGHTPMITLRHPQWQTDAPYQDIPILVFTHAQWFDLHQGQLWPSYYAGGVMYEEWHNKDFVFGPAAATTPPTR